jgi:hypothetical protein
VAAALSTVDAHLTVAAVPSTPDALLSVAETARGLRATCSGDDRVHGLLDLELA